MDKVWPKVNAVSVPWPFHSMCGNWEGNCPRQFAKHGPGMCPVQWGPCFASHQWGEEQASAEGFSWVFWHCCSGKEARSAGAEFGNPVFRGSIVTWVVDAS